jgi:hypothetical protein
MLFHGSSHDFEAIDFQKCGPYKSFGKWFRASANISLQVYGEK